MVKSVRLSLGLVGLALFEYQGLSTRELGRSLLVSQPGKSNFCGKHRYRVKTSDPSSARTELERVPGRRRSAGCYPLLCPHQVLPESPLLAEPSICQPAPWLLFPLIHLFLLPCMPSALTLPWEQGGPRGGREG